MVVDHLEPITLSQEKVAFTTHHFALGLPWLTIESSSLAFNPSQLADHRKSDSVIRNSQRRCHSNATMRRINTEMEVLDVLSDDLHGQPIDGYFVLLSSHADF